MHRQRFINDKEIYVMSELLEDFKEISLDYGLRIPPERFISVLKAQLEDVLVDPILFSKVGKSQVLYLSFLRPVFYVERAMNGRGMKEDDLTKAFARLVQGKLQGRDHLNGHLLLIRCLIPSRTWPHCLVYSMLFPGSSNQV